jgi:FdhD protein
MFERLLPLPATEPIPYGVIGAIPPAVSQRQTLFDSTGAVHAAATFDRDGNVRLVREDVGRHNAVDKIIGASLLAGDLPAAGLGLFVSGRASVEMVQKAWAAGFGTLVAVSAPTALAVDAARRAGLVLVGFMRSDRFNVYAPDRLGQSEPAAGVVAARRSLSEDGSGSSRRAGDDVDPD